MLLFDGLADGTSARTERLRVMFERAGLSVAVDRDIRLSIWRKFLMFCAFGGVATVTRLPYRALVACPETRGLCRGALEEGVAVAHACGIAMPEGFVDQALAFVEELPLLARPSQYRDLVAGRRLEIDFLNGTLVQLGAERGSRRR
jgi:2-dehydropantoate 2-reductase